MIDVALLVCMSLLSAGNGGPEPGAWARRSMSETPAMITALAVGETRIAVGLSSGGVRIVDPSLSSRTDILDAAFGTPGRIRSLAWSAGDLWIASDGGLFRHESSTGRIDRSQRGIPSVAKSGVEALFSLDDQLWTASRKAVAVFSARAPDAGREWKTPVDVDPSCLLRVGGRAILGTGTRGLFVLDSVAGAWKRLTREDGLSSDQVTGLEWVGSEVFVATSNGLDALELSTQKLRTVVPGLGVFWMTQIHGVLIASSSDGLLRIDPSTRKTEIVALPQELHSDGALHFDRDVLAVASGSVLLVRENPTILGDGDVQLDSVGFRVQLSRKVPQGVSLKAWLRLPEWPSAKVELAAEPVGERLFLVRTPGDLRGTVQLDLVATKGGLPQEIRSVEAVGDRDRPFMALDPAASVIRDSQATISGKAFGVGPLRLMLLPEGRAVEVASDGRFRVPVVLRMGTNPLVLRLDDVLGRTTSRDVTLSFDNQPPVLLPVRTDTVVGDFARVTVRYRDASPVQASVRAASMVRPAVFDSFVVIEARKLSIGENLIRLSLVDEAGNRDSIEVGVIRRQVTAGLDTGLASADDYLASYTPWGTESAHPGVHILHYSMLEGETICGVSEKFYGTQALATILIRWNGFEDSSQWRKMPIGTAIDVPFWKDFEFGRMELREAVATFPWALVPPGPRNRR